MITEQNPEHLINRKIQPTEDLNTDTRFFFLLACVATHFSFCLSAYTRRAPSAGQRGHALLLSLICVQYAPNGTIAPHTSQEIRTQKNNRAAYIHSRYAPKGITEPRAATAGTHLNDYRSAYLRTDPSAPLRTHALNLRRLCVCLLYTSPSPRDRG